MDKQLPYVSTESDGQVKQGAGPDPVLYMPLEHFEHTVPFSPVYPGSQRHAVLLVLPFCEVELRGQGVQGADPIPVLYVSSKHSEHVLPSASVYPAAH
jgi:hypothetical protein